MAYWSLYLKSLGFNSLTIGSLVAILPATKLIAPYIWGWLADRYGSKTVMAVSVLLLPLLPLAWILIPRQVTLSLYLALAIAFAQGHFDHVVHHACIMVVSNYYP